MSNYDYTKFLLDIKEENIILDTNFPPSYEVNKQVVEVKLIQYLTNTSFVVCSCGAHASRLHDYRTIKIKHYFLGQQPLRILLKKKHFVCSHCLRKVTEQFSFVSKHCFISNDIKCSIAVDLPKSKSMKMIAQEHNVSHSSVRYILDEYRKAKHQAILPKVLSFDEFRANTYAGKYACILTDIENKRVVDVLPDRKYGHLCAYFDKFSQEERDYVQFIVMDMWQPYREIAKKYFPKARVVSDKFHYVRLVGQVLMNARIQASKRLPENKCNHLKKHWRLIQKKATKLEVWKYRYYRFKKGLFTESMAVDTLLSYDPTLERVYVAYQEFLIISTMHEAVDRRRYLDKWIQAYGNDEYETLRTCVKSIENWKEEILTSFETGYSNGYTEGINNRIKVIKRTGYGIRNFFNFRTRILLSTNIIKV